MFVTAQPKADFTNTSALKDRFQKLAKKTTDEQKVVDKFQNMADAFLMLDGSKHDQDENPLSVAVGDDKGVMAFVSSDPFGDVFSLDVLDESGPEVKEYSVQRGLTGVSYTETINGVKHELYKDGNGLLMLMERMEGLLPQE